MKDYSNVISSRMQGIRPSGIRKYFDLLETMDDALTLGVGQPDFETPWHISQAAVTALQKGKTFYTGNAGLHELRAEVCRYLHRRFGLTYEPAQTLITVGGSEAIDLCIRVLVDQGDEVIIPQPSFVCYGPLTEVCGGKPVYVGLREEDRFKLTPEILEKAITPRTKLVVVPFPSNPTGAIMTREELEAISRVIIKHDLFVLSDEIYAELNYGTHPHVSIASLPGMKERTVVVNGFSKAYAMTGWRLGFCCGPQPVMTEMLKLHQYGIMCAPTISQYGAVEALRNGDEDIAYMVNDYNERRRLILAGLRSIGMDCFEPEGAFYVFPSIQKFGLSSEEFCEGLLRSERLAVVPGNSFGENGEGFIRLCYAYSIDTITKALDRMGRFISTLK
ncbi:MAG: aminotransferase class I/II-fold pyridoxal phosphate-dependent enzyme [Clostridia bacterium]|nr:aminotransferase class I/II-fold pyridoxal phosphate-dependent enzyme [Clostridia bacterium]